MRKIRTMLVVTKRQSKKELMIKTNFMYVRSGLPLPVIGEPVIAVEEESGVEFPGEVIEVDQVRHGYTARIRIHQDDIVLSEVIG